MTVKVHGRLVVIKLSFYYMRVFSEYIEYNKKKTRKKNCKVNITSYIIYGVVLHSPNLKIPLCVRFYTIANKYPLYRVLSRITCLIKLFYQHLIII